MFLFEALQEVPARAIVPATVAVAFVLLLASSNRYIRTCILSLVSRVFGNLLLWYYPIKNIRDGSSLPSLPYVFPNGQGNIEKFLNGRANSAKWEKENGELYRLWSGMKSEIVLTKPAHVERIFSDSHMHIKAHANNSGYLMDRLLGSCLGLISGRPWQNVKSSVEAPLMHRLTNAYVNDVQVFTKAFMSTLAKENALPSGSGKLHPVRDLKLLPFLFVARIMYGPLEAGLEAELRELIPLREEVFRDVIAGGLTRFSFSRFLPLPAIRKLNEFKDRWAAWSDRAYESALSKANMDTAAPVAGMYKAVEDGAMTREQLLQTLDEMLFANIDVTMGGLSWTLVFLAANPSVQSALRHEIRQYSTSSTARNSYLLSSWTSHPTLLGASLLEAARLRPLAAFSVPQACPTVRELDGFEIPAGTNFVIDSYALNIRDPFWGEDREKFRPERWLERQKKGKDLRYRYWRFGFGPRTCLGKYVAELVLRSVVVEVVENWQLSLGAEKSASGGQNEADWPWDDEMWIHHPDLLLGCKPLEQ